MLPWWSKIGAKLVLSKLPVSYACWSSRFKIFRHGHMDEPRYALEVYARHFSYCRPPPGFTCLELGPGDSLATAILTRAFGGAGSYLVDVGNYASQDLTLYRELSRIALQSGLRAPDLSRVETVEEMLQLCNANYLTEGLSSMQALPPASVDFVFSQSCLEHIRLSTFEPTIQELRRLISPRGCCSHRVDLMDHLDHDLNNLRFPHRVWESDVVATSGFYTNRIRYTEMLDLFRRAGFAVEVTERKPFPKPRLKRSRLNERFRVFNDNDLDVAVFSVRCRPAQAFSLAAS